MAKVNRHKLKKVLMCLGEHGELKKYTTPAKRGILLDVDLSAPTPKKAGRNDRCPCGSGMKFKRCCMGHQ